MSVTTPMAIIKIEPNPQFNIYAELVVNLTSSFLKREAN